MTFGKFLVWLIIGALAGNLAGWVVTWRKEGLGRWLNLGVGMIGALLGGAIFHLFDIDLGLGEFKVSFEDLVSAFLGSLLCITLWWLIRRSVPKPAEPVGETHD